MNSTLKIYVLISGKCLFDNKDMYVMISTAFKIELIEDEIPSTGPYISFVGKVYSRPKQDDCVFGINVSEYNNNFNFTNKGKVNFKIQVVYDAGQDSRFRNLHQNWKLVKIKSEEQSDDKIDHKSVMNLTNQGSKRKNQLAELSLRRLKKAKNLDNNDEEFGLDSQVTGKELS
ncbi:hypothetical protein RhiirA1_438237 [Rhizophagus irregularis]|uniref:Uncharacterized protein n=1 Tax=Rhizophagus irregularis TaxID=588596 RepID=A0A2N0SAB4_9GLOM|nr:hypothetical protein RhiirA1_438237 [Rhizophagus irregularis]UZO01820.1 hypothetical protein OCT59_020330 [Rhizophagus irregularis]CAB4474712.1 unnamed protein product [Rhizophagus irregularis]CAB5182357.1 unnamed protein product [Rhizophagus irregularis]